jgi:ADP-ribosyl-[dinitrogen reductase] hydrolase
MLKKHDALVGCALGTAVGDALGLPYEGLSKQRGKALFGKPDRHRLCFGYGMLSDDTEHTAMAMQALIRAPDNADEFQGALAWKLRFWLLSAPAGCGLATLRAILKLLLGFSPKQSGVFSAGNGPAMRAPILGAFFDEPTELARFVRVSTRITHTDPEAEAGAFTVALAAQMARKITLVAPADFVDALAIHKIDPELLDLIKAAADASSAGTRTQEFAAKLGLRNGVSGYMYHTVPVAIHAWFTHPRDFKAAVMSIIECGGDTDLTAAIVGGILGAAIGKSGIPVHWISATRDWPRSMAWLESLALQLATPNTKKPITAPYLAVCARNALFLLIVLFHIARRALPPYS